MTKFYTVAQQNGEHREYNLTLREAAQMILHHDGGDYDIVPARLISQRRFGSTWDLWTRNKTAGIRWSASSIGSKTTEGKDAATIDIFEQVVVHSRLPNCRGLVAFDQDDYRRTLDYTRAEEDDPEP